MKIDELGEELRAPFTKERGYGVMKLRDAPAEWKNIHFVVPKAPPRKIEEKLPASLLAEALKVIGALPRFEQMSEIDKLVNYLFVRREVVQSSRLEGTWSTIDHALTPIGLIDSQGGKNEHCAVRSYASIMDEIIAQASVLRAPIFTENFICDIQKRIVVNDPNSAGVAGKLRTEGDAGSIVTIGGMYRKENSIYNPAPASEVKRCLEEVLDWLRDDELAQMGDAGVGGMSLPIRLAVAHAHFEAVHPFTDGNGRTGRALWPVQMVCAGHMPLYLSAYVEANKQLYARALEHAQKKLNYIPLIEFICNAIIESDLENQKTKEAIFSLEKSWQERGRFRAHSGPRRALHLLLTFPIITTRIVEQELGLSKTASVDTIKALEKAKIIHWRSNEKRMRIYAAEELIQLLSRPFGEEVDVALEKLHLTRN